MQIYDRPYKLQYIKENIDKYESLTELLVDFFINKKRKCIFNNRNELHVDWLVEHAIYKKRRLIYNSDIVCQNMKLSLF